MGKLKYYIIPNKRTRTAGIKESKTMSMKFFFILFFLLCGIRVQAQDTNLMSVVPASQTIYTSLTEKNLTDITTDYTQTKYWKRRRWLAVSGVLCLAAGSADVGIGAVCGAWDGDIYKPVFVPGCILVAASIPQFVLANVNKRKAKRAVGLSLKASDLDISLPNGAKSALSALGICFHF